MRKIIRKILQWFLHEHNNEIEYRVITHKQHLGKNKKDDWVDSEWLKITWHLRCKKCGLRTTQTFKR